MDHAELFLVFSQSTKLWHEAGTGPSTCACHPFAVCTWRTSVNSFIQRPFVQSAQNLTPENLRAGVKPSMHRRVTCPQWWPWSIMHNLPPQRECSSSVPLTLPLLAYCQWHSVRHRTKLWLTKRLLPAAAWCQQMEPLHYGSVGTSQ